MGIERGTFVGMKVSAVVSKGKSALFGGASPKHTITHFFSNAHLPPVKNRPVRRLFCMRLLFGLLRISTTKAHSICDLVEAL